MHLIYSISIYIVATDAIRLAGENADGNDSQLQQALDLLLVQETSCVVATCNGMLLD